MHWLILKGFAEKHSNWSSKHARHMPKANHVFLLILSLNFFNVGSLNFILRHSNDHDLSRYILRSC